MGQGRTGWWMAGICAVVVLISIGYGLGRRAANSARAAAGLSPAGAPSVPMQVEPIQPQAELAAITVAPAAETQPSSSAAPAAAASQAAAPAGGESAVNGVLESSARIREIQKALKAAGFDPGTIDGKMGPKTHVAIRDFQRANGLQPDGKVGPKTWAKLESYFKQGTNTNE